MVFWWSTIVTWPRARYIAVSVGVHISVVWVRFLKALMAYWLCFYLFSSIILCRHPTQLHPHSISLVNLHITSSTFDFLLDLWLYIESLTLYRVSDFISNLILYIESQTLYRISDFISNLILYIGSLFISNFKPYREFQTLYRISDYIYRISDSISNFRLYIRLSRKISFLFF